jgi:cysteine desulfurase
VYGGGQERAVRPGTENVPGIVGAAVAFVEAQQNWKERALLVSQVRDEAITILKQTIPELLINGAQGRERLANNVNVSILGLDTEFAAIVLDSKGFAVSTKSACAGAGGGESTVVKETTGDSARAASTLRFSLSPETSVEDMQKLAAALKTHVQQMSRYSF